MLPYNGWLLVLSACILGSIIYASVADCTGLLARGCDIPDNLLLVPRLAYFWIAYAIGHLPVSVEHVVALSPHRCRKAHACRDCHLCCYYWPAAALSGSITNTAPSVMLRPLSAVQSSKSIPTLLRYPAGIARYPGMSVVGAANRNESYCASGENAQMSEGMPPKCCVR
jgi:hypothetical protein